MLTIALPIYNGAHTIRLLLDSVVKNIKNFPEVEVLVLDNASTDNSLEVVEDYLPVINNMRIVSHSKNMGPDFNFSECVHQAKNEYVWIIGADDIIADGGVAEVLSVLATNVGLGAIVCNYSLRPGNMVEVHGSAINIQEDYLSDSVAKLVSKAGLHMNFLSAVVHSKKGFISIDREKYYNTYWLQLGVFLEYILNKTVYVISRPIIINAGESSATEVNTDGRSVSVIRNILQIVVDLRPTLGEAFYFHSKNFVYPNLLRKLYIGKRTGYKSNKVDYEFFVNNIPEGLRFRSQFQLLFWSPCWVSKVFHVLYQKLGLQKLAFKWLFK